MKSLELNWIRNVDKSLVIPEVVFELTTEVGGYYWLPEKRERCIDGIWYDQCFGIIVVSSCYPDSISNTLAHEWRHHWQRCNGWKYDGVGWNCPDKKDYDRKIVDYFTSSHSEMDALNFEIRYTPEDSRDYWLELLSKEK